MWQFLMPALIPSWRFFDTIGPSPRIEYALLSAADDKPTDWHAFQPLPQHLSCARVMLRMVWNPDWNETLYLLRCAEKLLEDASVHAERELSVRIVRLLAPVNASRTNRFWLVFRIVLVQRTDASIVREPAYESRPLPCFPN